MVSGYARLPLPIDEGVPYGQVVVVRDGRIVREFLHDLQDPSHDVNRGRLELERAKLIDDWVDAAWFVDNDELADDGADDGLLLLFEGAGPRTTWPLSEATTASAKRADLGVRLAPRSACVQVLR